MFSIIVTSKFCDVPKKNEERFSTLFKTLKTSMAWRQCSGF